MNARILVLLCLAVAAAVNSFANAADVPLHGDAVIHFAAIEEGVAILGASDRFTQSLSRFDLQSRLNTNRDVTEQDLLKFAAKEVVGWSDDEQAKVAAVVGLLRARLDAFDIPLPDKITLVKTTGKEEGNAAYCRGNAIVLPQKVVDYPPDQLERLLIHELFHIVSSHNPRLRQELYAIIGFRRCGPIPLPEMFQNRKITNPDAPAIEYYIELEEDGTKYQAAPILYASVEDYDPEKGGSFFRYLLFRLLVIERQEGRWRAPEKDGKPIVLDVKGSASYFDQIGRNTNYIIHPDEILADNFVHLVKGTTDLATPRIVDQMRTMLRK